MHGTISPNSNNNRGLATYLHYAAFPLGVTLLIATTVYIFVLSTPRMDMIVDHPSKSQRNQQQLRSRSNFLAPLEEHDEFHQMNDLLLPSLWNDVFLSPLMQIDPFFRQHQTTNANMWQDLVFDVTQNEDSHTEEEQIALLQVTVDKKSFVGEPHVLLAQIYFRQGRFLQAAIEARKGLEKFYTLASCWDKRRSFEYWIGYGRIMLLRANRMLEGQKYSWPSMDPENPLYINNENLKLTSLHHVVEEMKSREEEPIAA